LQLFVPSPDLNTRSSGHQLCVISTWPKRDISTWLLRADRANLDYVNRRRSWYVRTARAPLRVRSAGTRWH